MMVNNNKKNKTTITKSPTLSLDEDTYSVPIL